jgi:hypothetical protein
LSGDVVHKCFVLNASELIKVDQPLRLPRNFEFRAEKLLRNPQLLLSLSVPGAVVSVPNQFALLKLFRVVNVPNLR